MIFSVTVLLLCVTVIVESENVRTKLFMNGICYNDEYVCANQECVHKSKYCNGFDDCGDNSDEFYCSIEGHCPEDYGFKNCIEEKSGWNARRKCFIKAWICDGQWDCPKGDDENNCPTHELSVGHLVSAKENAIQWLTSQRDNTRILLKWGSDITKKAVALFLSKRDAFANFESHFHEIACDLNSNFLSKLALRKIEDMHFSELASYINAFLVTCIDPRKFYVIDLVQELRKRVDAMTHISPFAVLTLCNAKEPITEVDVQKLLDVFAKAHTEFRTDFQAMTLMALSCAEKQSGNLIDHENLSELSLELKRKQADNGTIDNIKTTALVMQALFASEHEPDQENFDESKAINQILQSQEPDGSFGGIMNTYYALPVLSYLSLLNITSSHCSEFHRTEKETLQFLKNQIGDKYSVKYSLLIGNDKTLQKTLTLNVHKNLSFYEIMEYAADLDTHYHFKYNIRDMKPYVYSLSSLMDDPELELFWIPYYVTNETTVELNLINKSPVDIFPKDQEHLAFWYRRDA